MIDADVARRAARELREPREILVTVYTTLSRTVAVPGFEYRDCPEDAVDYAISEVEPPEAPGWECTGDYRGEVVEP